MDVVIETTDEERKLAEKYAEMHGSSLEELFKSALFERIEVEKATSIKKQGLKRAYAKLHWLIQICPSILLRIFWLPKKCPQSLLILTTTRQLREVQRQHWKTFLKAMTDSTPVKKSA